jgi:hypothetical protein
VRLVKTPLAARKRQASVITHQSSVTARCDCESPRNAAVHPWRERRPGGGGFPLCSIHRTLATKGSRSTSSLMSRRSGRPLVLSSSSLVRLPAWLLGSIRRHERLIVRARRFLQLIGWTPLIELKRIAGKEGVDARIVGKVESYQPLFSVKDRCALRSNFFSSLLPYWLGNSDGTRSNQFYLASFSII